MRGPPVRLENMKPRKRGIEDVSLKWLACRYGLRDVYVTGFMTELKRVLRETGDDAVVEDIVDSDLMVVPDGWRSFTEPNGTIVFHLYEIEDTSKMSRDKLERYSLLWYIVDGESQRVTFEVFPVDRYGNAQPSLLVGLGALCR